MFNTASTDRFNGFTASIAIKAPCKAVTAANITLSGEQTVNGVAVVDGDRVLVKDQTDPIENGIYEVRSAAWDRTPDFDGNRDVVNQTLVVAAGNTYKVDTANPILPGTTSLSFSLYSPALSAPDLQTVTDIGNTTYSGLVLTNLLSTGQVAIDVTDGFPTGGPVNIVCDVDLNVDAADVMTFDVGAGGNMSFGVGGNNSLTIQDKVVRVNTDSGGYFEIRDDAGSYTRMEMTSAGLNIEAFATPVAADRLLFMPTLAGEGLAFMLYERAAARADIAGYGQFWVRSDTPNTPMFTDDAGTDHNLLTATGITRADIDSETFADGFVLTADGAGNAFWEDIGVGTRTIAGSWTFTPGWAAAGNCLVSRSTDTFRYIAWRDINTDRWALGFRDSANTDDFVITRTNSSGIFEDIPFTIKGSDGAAGGHIIIANDLTIGNMFFDNSGNSFRLSNGTDMLTMQQQPDITQFSFTGVNTFQLSNLAAGMIIQDGAYLRINDSLDTDYAQFSHDGTDFNTTFFQTTEWNIGVGLNITGGLTASGAGVFSTSLNAVPLARSVSATTNTETTDYGIIINLTGGTGQTFTLDGDPPTNAVVMFDNSAGAAWTIAASTSLIWAKDGTTGSRTLADDGVAVAKHRGSGTWIISGSALLT